jgi:hypothetical protein
MQILFGNGVALHVVPPSLPRGGSSSRIASALVIGEQTLRGTVAQPGHTRTQDDFNYHTDVQ